MRHLKVLLFALVMSFSASAQVDTSGQDFYMFIYFLNSNDQAGARIALSNDGITWQRINNGDPVIVPILTDEHRMRDPNTHYDPETGVFHLIWTTGWNQKCVGYSTSKDLRNWSPQLRIDVGERITGSACCWAPEFFYDDLKDSVMVYWSTERGSKGKEAFYCMTKDFKRYTTPSVYFDPGYTVIDETIIKVANNSYYMFFKDERDPAVAGKQAQNIHYVTAPTPQGPWSLDGPWDKVSNPISLPGMEGPTAIKMGSEFWVYFDPFKIFSNTYRMVKTTDLSITTWPWPKGEVLKTSSGDFLFSHGSISKIPKVKALQLLHGIPDPTSYKAWTPPTQNEMSVEAAIEPIPEYPHGKRNTGCGTGVGLALFPPIFFKVLSRRRRKKEEKGV